MISEDEYQRYLYNYNYYKKEPDMAKSATATISTFPGCCGIKIISEFIVHRYNNNGVLYNEEPRAGDEAAMTKYLLNNIEPDEKGCYIYTTIQTQKAEYNALRAAGFKVIGKFKNPSTGNWVLIHAWMNQPLPSRTRTVRGPRVIGRAAAPRRKAATRRLVRR